MEPEECASYWPNSRSFLTELQKPEERRVLAQTALIYTRHGAEIGRVFLLQIPMTATVSCIGEFCPGSGPWFRSEQAEGHQRFSVCTQDD